MASVAKTAVAKVSGLLRAPTGVNQAIAALQQTENMELAQLSDGQIAAQNAAADMADRTAGAQYPRVQVYCEKLVNDLREKFRTFSGTARMCVEVQVSQDRMEGLDAKLQLYVDAVAGVLDANRGDWGDGMFYAGGYEAAFGPAKHGGRNILQTAKVIFEVEISRS